MINKYFYNLSVTIVGIVTSVFILTTVGGLFHIPVNPFFVFIPFIGGVYYLKKQSPENIDFLKQFLILLLIIMISCMISVYVWDSSADGRGSHTATILLYKNGWLPVYHDFQDYAKFCHVHPTSAFWGNCYLHFVEIIGANIYKITNLLESAKATNFIMLSAVFMYSFSVLKEIKPQRKFIPFIISLLIILNPVCICQWFTNYIDLHIYFAFTLLVLTLIKVELQQETKKTDLFMFVFSALMLAMAKFTGSMYLFVICCIYLIYLFLLKREVKKYIKTVIIIALLIAVTGVNPFYTNIRNYGHIFYPVFGKNKMDIIRINFPVNFENIPKPERFLRSNFSESVQSVSHSKEPGYKRTTNIKIPFSVGIKSPENLFYFPDMRVGGFGYLWSGILLFSLFYLPFIRFRNKNEKNIFLLITPIVLFSTLANPHCWWARYVPQFWLFPVFILFFGLLQEDYKNKLCKLFKLSLLYFMMLSFFINSLIIMYQNTKFDLHLSGLLKKTYNYIDLNKKPEDKILLMVRPDPVCNNMCDIDETIIPHLEEYYGKENIIYIPYNKNKVISERFIQMQNVYVLDSPYYFIKIEKKP